MNKAKRAVSVHELPLETVNSDLTTWFSAIACKPWSILLQSGGPLREDSRYHIISSEPIATFCYTNNNGQLTYADKRASKQLQGDPLKLAKQINNELFGETSEWPELDELPFIGGAMGFLTYDLGRHFENLPSIAKADIDLPEMAIAYYDWSLIFDKKKHTLTLVQMGTKQQLQQRLNWLQTIKAQSQEPFKLSSQWQSNLSKEAYLKRFNQVQDYLLSGDCYQINLAQRFTAQYQGDEWLAYQSLTEQNQSPFSSFIRLDKAAILSVSPERFMQISIQNEKDLTSFKVQTKPIKGTRARGQTTEQDLAQKQALLNSEKDRAENLMIVDLLRNDISRVCKAGSVEVPKLFDIESYAAVHHMVSTVEGRLAENYSAWELLAASFPGGSITGAPKIRAMEIIEELEPHRRSLYCGSIFYIGANGRGDSNITIRTLIANNEQLHCWGGGGLVADSVGEDEYQETLDKLAKILPVLS